jgi:ribosomal protein S27E
MEFSCPECGSPAIVYPDRLTDDAPVKCRHCETVLCTVREFRSSAQEGIARIGMLAQRLAPQRRLTDLVARWRAM